MIQDEVDDGNAQCDDSLFLASRGPVNEAAIPSSCHEGFRPRKEQQARDGTLLRDDDPRSGQTAGIPELDRFALAVRSERGSAVRWLKECGSALMWRDSAERVRGGKDGELGLK